MSTAEADRVRRHYEPSDAGDGLIAKVRLALDALPGPVSVAALAGFDQFHVRGLAATVELGELLDINSDSRVLDAGCGLGGPSRHVAETYRCGVDGVDLTPSYVEVARLLAERSGLGDRVHYLTGDLLALPFADRRFDVIYTQHVVMNIGDRAGLYGELRRLLRPGGRFGFYDVLAADGKPAPHFPLPWAATQDTSFLLTEAETRTALASAGLIPKIWRDVTAAAVDWLTQPRPPASGPTLAMVMGPRFGQMAANLARNLGEGRLRLIMARCEIG